MRRFLPRAFVFLLTMLVTWIATNSIMAQLKGGGRPKEVVAPDAGAVVDSKKFLPSGVRPEIPAAAPTKPTLSLTGFDAGVAEGGVKVSGSVAINDEPGTVYVWSLHVFDAQDKSIKLTNVYDHQPLTVPKSGRSSPTFSDTVQLAPGNYKVVLRLNEIPPGFSPLTLTDPKIPFALDTIRGVRTVTIY